MERLKILVVEDDPIYASFVTETLREAGHEVVIAKDGGMARKFAGAVPDAIILDLKLPDESGYDVARALRKELPTSAVIIALTASVNPERDLAEAVGIDLVLTKPVSEELVVEIIAFVRSSRERKLQR